MSILQQAIRNHLVAAAREASRREIMPRFRCLSPADIATKSAPDDLVTAADRAAEHSIYNSISGRFPDVTVIGEEAVDSNPELLDELGSAETAVLIDPIDGTRNYVAGIALFGIILAVLERGRTVFGLLYDPVMDDWVLAGKGEGVWYCRPNHDPVRLQGPPQKREPGELLVHVSLHLYPEGDRSRIASQFPHYGRVSSLGCSCHEYRMLAFGHADAIVSPMPKPWDHAAGVLVAEECGGRSWMNGRPGYDAGAPPGPLAVAGNAHITLDDIRKLY